MSKLTFIMPEDKAAQIILTKRGNEFLIRDRKYPGEKTIVPEDEFYSETTFDTLEEAYDFCRQYDPDYVGNYLFGDLDLDLGDILREPLTTLTVGQANALPMDAGFTVPAGITVDFKWYKNGSPIDNTARDFDFSSFSDDDSGEYLCYVQIVGDHNRKAQYIKYFNVLTSAGELRVSRAPWSIEGYYPLYEVVEDAINAGDGTYHTHTFDGTDYYMPNGVTFYHGDYNSSGY